MKTFKRFVATTVAILMILSSLLCVNIFAEESTVTFTDVSDDHTYANAIYTLVKEGVIDGIAQEDGTYVFKPDDTITRAEFAKLIAVALVSDESLLTQTTDKFPDVEADHWANKYIAYAVSMGIISGRDDGTFRPANPVTYGEAAKMIVCAKGYGEAYETTDPWYEGYVTLANQTGVSKNAVLNGAAEAPRALVAQLIYNLRDVKYYQPKTTSGSGGGGGGGGGGNDRVSGSVEEENEEESGIVTAVFDTTLTGEEYGLTYKQLMVDEEIYSIGDFKLDTLYNYLGKRVDIEYSEKASGKKILEKISVSSRNSVLTIKAEDFYGISGRTITYYPIGENKTDAVSLSEDLRVIYNGYSVPIADITEEFIAEYLNVESGQMSLINNNGGKDYEVVQVSKYDTYYVSSRSVTDKTYNITDSYSETSIALKEDDCTVYKVTSVGGVRTEGKMADIGVNKVLSVAQPYDRTEGTTVIVSEATLKNGEVDAISGEYVTINNKEYMESSYYTALKESDPKEYKYEVGSKGQFYFDYSGKLSFFKKAANTDPYAYVLGFDYGDGLNGICSIYLYTISGSSATAKVFAFKETVKINGQNKEPEDVGAILKVNTEIINKKSVDNDIKILNGDHAQLIRYKSSTTTVDGESVPCITEIYTIDSNDIEDGTVVPGLFRTGKEGEKSAFTDGKNKLKYVSSSKAFQDEAGSNQFIINSSTVVILVPDDRGDADEYKKKTYSYFSNGSKYDVEPYDIKSNVAGVLLVYTRGASTAATVTISTNVSFVESISSKSNSDGKTVKQLTYYNAGDTTPKTILTEKENTLDGISPGDVVKLAIETDDNVVVNVQKVFVGGQLYDWKSGAVFDTFLAEGNVITHANGSSYPEYYQVIHGTIESKNIDSSGVGEFVVVPMIATTAEDNLEYQTFKENNWKNYNVTTSTKVYKWNTDTSKYEVVDTDNFVAAEDLSGDAMSASKVVVIRINNNNTAKAVYIVE